MRSASAEMEAATASIFFGRFSSANFCLKESFCAGALDAADWVGLGLSERTPASAPCLLAPVRQLRAAALRQHVRIAAGIFGPAAAAVRGDDAGDGAVEEIAVVAGQQHRAGITPHQFLQQVERLHVEIVGRLVQHQQVRGAASTRARISRARSPPESSRIGVRACSGLNGKSFM